MVTSTEPEEKNGNLTLKELSFETRQAKDSVVAFKIIIANSAASITLDPDKCGGGSLLKSPGYLVKPHIVLPDGTDIGLEQKCARSSNIGTNETEWTGQFGAPSDLGNYEVRAYMELVQSGDVSRRIAEPLEVVPASEDDETSTIKDELDQPVTIESTSIQPEVQPDFQNDISVKVLNSATLDQQQYAADTCNPTSGTFDFKAGISVQADMFIDGSLEKSETACVGSTGGEHTFGLTWFTGDFDVGEQVLIEVIIRGASSKKVLDTVSQTVRISETATEEREASTCTSDTDCPGEKICVNGICIHPDEVRDSQVGDDPFFPGTGGIDAGSGTNLLTTAIENPVGAGAVVLGGMFLLNKLLS